MNGVRTIPHYLEKEECSAHTKVHFTILRNCFDFLKTSIHVHA